MPARAGCFRWSYQPPQGAAEEKKTGKTTYICAARKTKYVRAFCFLIFVFSAFLGVSRQGEFEKNHRGNIFQVFFSPGGFLFTFFIRLFVVALVKRLSVRGTQKRETTCATGSCV
jgi:hypothetical protein